MEKAKIKQIDEATWQFTEQFLGEDVYCYLLTGTKKALLIDTAYGFTDIKGAAAEITSLPLTIVNTHGHFDHICGNRFFDEVFLHEKDKTVYRHHSDLTELESLLGGILGGGKQAEGVLSQLRPVLSEILSGKHVRVNPLPEEGFFELGERRVEIIETPGHTEGSISLLDVKNGWLFSGDTCGDEGMLLHFPEGTDVKTFHNTIRKIRALADEGRIKQNFPCHQTSPAPLERLTSYEDLLTRIETGGLTEEEWSTGMAMGEGIRIAFNPQKVKEEIR